MILIPSLFVRFVFLIATLGLPSCVEVRKQSKDPEPKSPEVAAPVPAPSPKSPDTLPTPVPPKVDSQKEAPPKDTAPKDATPAAPVLELLSAEQLKASIGYEFLPGRPNHYRIALKFPPQVKVIDRWVEGVPSENMNYQVTSTTGNQMVDKEFQGGTQVHFRFFQTRENFVQATYTIPTDFVLTAPADLNAREEWVFRRIFLNREARIQTSGKRVTIVAEEIHSDGATVFTHAEGSTANYGQAGLHGGRIVIKAKKLVGTLNVIMRGQNGAAGKDGADWVTRAAPGTSYSFRDVRECENAKIGGAGQEGLPGLRGENGTAGGDAGSLHVDIGDLSQGSVRETFIPGEGGLGGKGGKGQLGGEGGKTEELRREVSCEQPRGCTFKSYLPCPQTQPRGPEGKVGPQGAPGNPGRRGDAGEFCRMKEGVPYCSR